MIKSKEYRKISIDGMNYGWMVKRSKGFLVLHVEPYDFDGSSFQLYIKSDIGSFWSDFPNIKGYNLRVIHPNDVRNIILRAIQDGWNPQEKLCKRTYNLEGEDLTKKDC